MFHLESQNLLPSKKQKAQVSLFFCCMLLTLEFSYFHLPSYMVEFFEKNQKVHVSKKVLFPTVNAIVV